MAKGFTRREDMLAWLRLELDAIAIRSVGLICTAADPGNAICIIDADEATVHRVHERVGGQIFGYSALLLHLPIAADFSCPRAKKVGAALGQQCTCWQSSDRS